MENGLVLSPIFKEPFEEFCKIKYGKNFIDKVVFLQIDDAERKILNVLFH